MVDTARQIQVVAVCTGEAAPLKVSDRAVLSAFRKTVRQGQVAVGALGLSGDEQADLSVHGGISKAVYVYPSEHLPGWAKARIENSLEVPDQGLPPGFMGENLLISGLLESEVWVGDTLRLPGCVLRVTEPRQPCYKFNAVMGYARAAKDMVQHSSSGFYCSVVEAGVVAAGDAIVVEPGQRGLSISDAFSAKKLKHLR
ncbi:MOSC domain-containing protein [Hydrogenophaga sp. 5NK40-0174]|uniref:MOSC domain-containing protein n=1 Tax=Hydrogenophaga sp. 5NK40-0174 TaxID=3127649 RepID=UPI00310AD16F